MIYFLELFPFLPIDLLNVHESSDLFLKCQIYSVEKSCYLITFTSSEIYFFFFKKISFVLLVWNILEGRTKP